MARTRGHVIVKRSGNWVKLYLAYNANPEWMLPVLKHKPEESARLTTHCSTGICQFNESGTPYEYHDYKKLDECAHENQVFDTLEAALASCVLANIYIWDDVEWSYKTLEQVVSPERLSEIRPLKRKRNVWREMRQAHEAEKEALFGRSEETDSE